MFQTAPSVLGENPLIRGTWMLSFCPPDKGGNSKGGLLILSRTPCIPLVRGTFLCGTSGLNFFIFSKSCELDLGDMRDLGVVVLIFCSLLALFKVQDSPP